MGGRFYLYYMKPNRAFFWLRNSKIEFIVHPFAVMDRTSDRYVKEI